MIVHDHGPIKVLCFESYGYAIQNPKMLNDASSLVHAREAELIDHSMCMTVWAWGLCLRVVVV